MSRSPKVSSGPSWSSSTAIKYKDPESLSNSPPASPPKSQQNKPQDKPKGRQSILQRITNLRKPSSGEIPSADKVTGSRLCASVMKFSHCDDPYVIDGSTVDSNGKPVKSGTAEEAKDGGEAQPNGPSTPLNAVVSVIHHKVAQCYEVVSYDVDNSYELNRLYVPAAEVSDLTKKTRLSFMGGPPEESLAVKFSNIMAFTFDSEKRAFCAHIVRPNEKNSAGKCATVL